MILQTFVGIDYLLNYIRLKLFQLLQDVENVSFFVCLLISGVFNSIIYQIFILKTIHLLILLI